MSAFIVVGAAAPGNASGQAVPTEAVLIRPAAHGFLPGPGFSGSGFLAHGPVIGTARAIVKVGAGLERYHSSLHPQAWMGRLGLLVRLDAPDLSAQDGINASLQFGVPLPGPFRSRTIAREILVDHAHHNGLLIAVYELIVSVLYFIICKGRAKKKKISGKLKKVRNTEGIESRQVKNGGRGSRGAWCLCGHLRQEKKMTAGLNYDLNENQHVSK
jgi:hypothetical protein